jgi:hypothetical protein
MWAYKNAFEIPHDDEERHRCRTHVDYPIALDARLAGGLPLGRRLQRRLRHRGEPTWLGKLITFFYWTWEAEPHLVMMWIRWKRPRSFASAAGRLAATFDLTLLGYWAVPTAPPWWSSEKAGADEPRRAPRDGRGLRMAQAPAESHRGRPRDGRKPVRRDAF